MGLSYLKVKKARIALRLLEKAVKLEPENLHIFEAYKDALGVMAIKHYHGGDYTLAADMLGFLKRKRNGRTAPPCFTLASSLKAKGGPTKGHLDIFEELYENNPQKTTVLGLQLGELYHRQGYDDDAKEIFAELEQTIPQIAEWKKSPFGNTPTPPVPVLFGRTSTPRP
jgi:tetratricopeptide (TPR) repeat protein